MRKPAKQDCLPDRRSKDTAVLHLVSTINSPNMGKVRQPAMDSQLLVDTASRPQVDMAISPTAPLQVVNKATIAHHPDHLVKEVMEVRDMAVVLHRLPVTSSTSHDSRPACFIGEIPCG
jgi:hypothetical protein